jgi:hypothetical protein
MKKELKKLIVTAISLALFGAMLLSIHPAGVHGSSSPVSIQKSPGKVVAEVVVLDADASKVLSALKSGLEGRALPEQAESKLSVMDPNRMRLLLQLSDRVLDRDHPTGSRLALLLMAMIIILS